MDSWRRNCVYPVFLTPCVGGLTFIAFICMVIPVFATTFVFNGFNETNLILEKDASLIRSQSVLALTTQTSIMIGRALYSIPVRMKRNETLSSFSTTFVFSIVPPYSEPGGQGMAFIVTPYTTLMGSLASQYLGLLNNTSNGQPYNHLFAVEFDTIQSVEFNDPDGNHVAVDINNLESVHAKTAGYWTGDDFPMATAHLEDKIIKEMSSGSEPNGRERNQLADMLSKEATQLDYDQWYVAEHTFEGNRGFYHRPFHDRHAI